LNIHSYNNQDWLAIAKKANWSVVGIATNTGISVRTLERHFLKTLGKTPRKWLTEQRLQQANELIIEGASVKQAAYSLGYRHATNLTRILKSARTLAQV
jgi:AraC-like DNA-binding protein